MAVCCQNCEQKTLPLPLPLPLPLWKVTDEVDTFLDEVSSSDAAGRCLEKTQEIILETRPK